MNSKDLKTLVNVSWKIKLNKEHQYKGCLTGLSLQSMKFN